MNIYDYMYVSDGVWYFKEPTALTVADLDQDQIFQGEKQEVFDKGTTVDPLPVLELPSEDMKPKENESIFWGGEFYIIVKDYRNIPVWEKSTGQESKVTETGELPDNLTDIPCPGQFYIWSETDSNWVLDEAAKAESIRLQNNATKKELSSYAESRISLIQDEIDLEMTNDLAGAEADLKAWKMYRILVDRTDTSIENPEWPKRPGLKE